MGDDQILGPDEIAAVSNAGEVSERDRIALAINALHEEHPRVHALVAPAAQPLVANIAAALEIDISMTVDPVDIVPMVAHSDVLLVNLGMLDRERREAALAAVATGTPFVLDPVKVDRSDDRLAFARTIIESRPRIIKGNRAEMQALAALQGDAVLVTTGADDEILAQGRRAIIANDTPVLARVIGTGCATGMLIAALSAVEPDPFLAATAGTALMAVAGQIAAEDAKKPGSFAVALIDVLSDLGGEEVAYHLAMGDV